MWVGLIVGNLLVFGAMYASEVRNEEGNPALRCAQGSALFDSGGFRGASGEFLGVSHSARS